MMTQSFQALKNKEQSKGAETEEVSPTKLNDNQSSSKLEKLSKLSQEFESKDLYSEKVHEKLSETVNSVMKDAFCNSPSKELMKKYLKPENCEWVRAPLLNPELYNSDSLPEDFKSNDKLLYKNQKLLTKGMIPIIQIMNKCLERSDTGGL